MQRLSLIQRISQGPVLLDGGMGSLLQKQGLKAGEMPETWNVKYPERITEVHRAYLEAGSRILLCNTFGAHPGHYAPRELRDVIRGGIACARRARREAGLEEDSFLALDMGPTGQLPEPFGTMKPEQIMDWYRASMEIALEEGVDLIFLETLNDLMETRCALLSARQMTDLPVFVSNAYGADGRLMTGATPEIMVDMLEQMGADAVGLNCSFGPDALQPVLDAYLSLAHVPVLFKPNAGLPALNERGETVYDLTPDLFARKVAAMVSRGVRLAGGCCGTTPEHIRALARYMPASVPVRDNPHMTRVSGNTRSVTFGAAPVLIGERINPTGKKQFREALLRHELNVVLREGIGQEEAGAQILDVNVGVPGIDEPRLLREAVEQLQTVTELPLQLDTLNPAAMEQALIACRGVPLLNSVNGSPESMAAIFPLMRRYGGIAIALTLDEKGIPGTASGRLEIARRILREAEKQGLGPHRFIFDPLAMALSTDTGAPGVTLETLSLLRRELGALTSLGISNVSFGLPERETVNLTFLTMALHSGLSAAILNPYARRLMHTFRAFLALKGMDSQCDAYIRCVQASPLQTDPLPSAPSSAPSQDPSAPSPLFRAVRQGFREEAARLAREALASRDGMSVMNQDLIPALNDAGDGFEKHTVFLPQLLMCAEAASAAFEEIRLSRAAAPAATHLPFVLATVRGDIHDIGKNMVRLMLESYGFPVIDLGRDVPPETVLQAMQDHNTPLCGLSALMTTTLPAMEETVELIHRCLPQSHVMVGGAVLNEVYARKIHADSYARDAMEAVRLAEKAEKEYLERKEGGHV